MSAPRPSLDELKAVASIGELLARERRARLSAERRLVSMQAELMRANAALDAHARRLADEIKPLRREAEEMRGQAGRAEGEARVAERRLRDALDATPDGFAIYDAGLSLVAANARYMAPFDELEEMAPGISYARVLELCADEGIVDIGMLRPDAWVASMLARVQTERPEPVVLRMWDGACVRMIHRRAASGDLVSLAVDITATMEREAELEEARHRAEAASRAKSAFLANMSHELRTPLGGILGMSGLLAEDDLTEDQRVQVEVIQASGEALLSIVDDVLDLGRIEGARMALRPAPFDPRATMEEVVRMLRPTAMERGLSVELDYDEGLPRRLVGDGVRVRQVLTNLVGNAVKFTPSGQVTIRALDAGAPAPGMVRLNVSVEDTGIGIAEGDLERMFGAFEQAESDRDRHHDGAGLGLTVTRRLVELMGGEVWADSAPGTGSCFGFRIDLPAAGDPDRADRFGGSGARVGSGAGGRGDADRRANGAGPNGAGPNGVGPNGVGPNGVGPNGVGPNGVGPSEDRRNGMPADGTAAPPEAAPRLSFGRSDRADGEPDRAARAGNGARPDGAAGEGPFGGRRGPRPNAAAKDEPQPFAASGRSDAPERAPRAGPAEAGRASGHGGGLDPGPAPAGGVPMFARRNGPPPDPEAPAPPPSDGREAPPGEAPEPPTAEAPLSEPPSAVSGPETGPRRMRVLAAEDNRANRLILKRMLAELDIALLFAADGAEAVAAFGRERPDLILMDISMPGMDGREATRRIRAAEGGAQVPIVAMTAHALAGDEEAIRAAGLDGYLAKPLRKAGIREVVLLHAPPGVRPPGADE